MYLSEMKNGRTDFEAKKQFLSKVKKKKAARNVSRTALLFFKKPLFKIAG